jgi:hypothetical protein
MQLCQNLTRPQHNIASLLGVHSHLLLYNSFYCHSERSYPAVSLNYLIYSVRLRTSSSQTLPVFGRDLSKRDSLLSTNEYKMAETPSSSLDFTQLDNSQEEVTITQESNLSSGSGDDNLHLPVTHSLLHVQSGQHVTENDSSGPTVSSDGGDFSDEDWVHPLSIIDNIISATHLESYSVDGSGSVEPYEYPIPHSLETLLLLLIELEAGFDLVHRNKRTRNGAICFFAQEEERPLVARTVDVYRGVYDQLANFEDAYLDDDNDYIDGAFESMEKRVDEILLELDERLILGECYFADPIIQSTWGFKSS